LGGAGNHQAAEFSAEEMRGWYLPRDLLGVEGEQVVPEHCTLQRTVAFIGNATGLPPSSTRPAARANPPGHPLTAPD
jgi:hypothetical protein